MSSSPLESYTSNFENKWRKLLFLWMHIAIRFLIGCNWKIIHWGERSISFYHSSMMLVSSSDLPNGLLLYSPPLAPSIFLPVSKLTHNEMAPAEQVLWAPHNGVHVCTLISAPMWLNQDSCVYREINCLCPVQSLPSNAIPPNVIQMGLSMS